MASTDKRELPQYAELHCLSNFTFQRGASRPEELVERATALGYEALAITDECSMAGVVRAHTEAKEKGLHLLIGTEIKVQNPSHPRPGSPSCYWPAIVPGMGNSANWSPLPGRYETPRLP